MQWVLWDELLASTVPFSAECGNSPVPGTDKDLEKNSVLNKHLLDVVKMQQASVCYVQMLEGL